MEKVCMRDPADRNQNIDLKLAKEILKAAIK